MDNADIKLLTPDTILDMADSLLRKAVAALNAGDLQQLGECLILTCWYCHGAGVAAGADMNAAADRIEAQVVAAQAHTRLQQH